MWRFMSLVLIACSVAAKCPNLPQGTAKLVCFYEGRKALDDVDICGCTHLVYTGQDKDGLKEMSEKMVEMIPKLKILLRVNGKDKDMVELVKTSIIHGVDFYEAHSALNRTKITTSTESIRSAIGSDAILMMTLPAQSELLAKYYDLKALSKSVTLFALETHNLGEIDNETFHPSRLSGVWDMLNTDSVVDLTIGLGIPSSKIIITSPAKALKFTLKNNTLSTPGSPTDGAKPSYLNQKELCAELNNGEKWTLERDQDLSAPYAFINEKWLAFEDSSSLDVKGKYARIRSLAGMGLVSVDDDSKTDCGISLLQTIVKALGSQSRAPRGAVLGSLEQEILSIPQSNRLVDAVQLSPYRISRVVDSDGVIHAIREDTRTEFECQRQGYFVHPRTCNRFYRCVKFDQLSDEYTVFEFDCPSGLAFDSRWEVCVWPGSLSDAQACPGSSEIAPVPKTRFVCPEKPGYYADPANCRWFFACLDHGKSPLSAYEFRCPFGLGFDESRLICDWPWLVPGCGNLGKYEASAYGHGSTILTGSSAYIGSSADSINIAGHQSLISGALASNHVGIQSGHVGNHDLSNQGYAAADNGAYYENGGAYGSLSSGYHNGASNRYENGGTYGSLTSGNNNGASNGYENVVSYTTGDSNLHGASILSPGAYNKGNAYSTANYEANGASINYQANREKLVAVSGGNQHGLLAFGNSHKEYDDSGAYHHDNSGDYKHDYSGEYKNDYGGEYQEDLAAYKYGTSGSSGNYYKNLNLNSGYYQKEPGTNLYDQSGSYKYGGSFSYQNGASHSGKYNNQYQQSGSYQHNSGSLANSNVKENNIYVNHVPSSEFASYEGGSNGYSGYSSAAAAHTLTAGAINAGLVGKTTLVDTNLYNKDSNAYYQNSGNSFIAINKQAQPIYVTPSPQTYTYSTTFSPPKSSLKQIFGIQTPAVSFVQPAVQISSTPQPSVSIISYNKPSATAYQGSQNNYQNENQYQSSGNGYTGQSQYLSQNYVSSTPKASVISYQKPLVTQYVNPLIAIKNVTPAPTAASISTYVQQPTYSTYTYQPTAPSVVKPSTYNLQYSGGVSTSSQNIVHQSNVVHGQQNYQNKVNLKEYQVAQPVYNLHSDNDQASYAQYSYNQGSYANTNQQIYSKPSQSYQQSVSQVQYNTQPVVSSTLIPLSNIETHSLEPNVQTHIYKGPEYLPPKIKYEPSVSVSSTPSPIKYSQQSVIHSFNTAKQVYNPPVEIKPIVQQGYVSTQPSYVHQQTYSAVPIISSTPAPPVVYQKPALIQTYHTNKHVEFASQKPQYFQPKIISSTPAPVVYQKPALVQTYHTNEHVEYAPQKSQFFQQKTVSSTPTTVVYQKPALVQTYHTNEHVEYAPQEPQYFQPKIVSSTPAPVAYQKPAIIQTYHTNDHLEYAPQKIEYVQPQIISSTPSVVHFERTFNYQYPKTQITHEYPKLEISNPNNIYLSSPAPFVQNIPKQSVASFHVSSNVHDNSFITEHKSYEKQQENEHHQYQSIVSSTPSTYQTYQSSTNAPIDHYSAVYINKQPVVSSTYAPVNYKSSSSYISHPPVISSTYTAPPSYQTVQSNTFAPIKYQSTHSSTPIQYESSHSSSDYNNVNKYTSFFTQKLTPQPQITSTYKAPTYLPPSESTTANYKIAEIPLAPYKTYSSTTSKPIYQEFGSKKINYNQNYQEYDSTYDQKSDIVYKKPAILVDYSSDAPPVNLLGFGTVGPNAGLISPPGYSSTQASYSTVSSPVTQRIIKTKIVTPAPYVQKIVEVTPPIIRKTRPKVAVVTKVNDFNPLLVRKLGAVCSCRSNVLKLRKPKPDYNAELEYDIEYENDYNVPINGDNDEEWTYKSDGLKSTIFAGVPIDSTSSSLALPVKSTLPIVVKKPKVTIVSSTLKPIIVPDEPQYYDEYSNYNSETKSTFQPIIVNDEINYSTTRTPVNTNVKIIADDENSYNARPIQIRKKVKLVTIAPTIASVLIPESQSLISAKKQNQDSPAFDRYGPGGWRGNDETLQGSIDCQRVGLFRHPKHCNKFYSCRWDCTKKKFTLHVFNCPVQLSFDPNLGACNWPSQGPACESNTLLPSGF